jgi:integrase
MSFRISVSLFRPRVTRKKKGQKKTTICKYWHAAWRDPQTHRRCTKSTGTKNRQSAEDFASKLKDKLYRQQIGTYNPAEDHREMTWKSSMATFLEAQTQRLRPHSVEAYRYSLVVFERIMKPQELRSVDRRTIDEFVIKRLRKVESVTVNKDLRHIRAFLNWCRRRHYLAVSPDFKGLFLLVDQADPTWVSDDDVKAIVMALADASLQLTRRSREWWGVFIRIALFTGMRRSELLGLRWSEVDFKAGVLKVIRYTSKGRRDRLYESARSLTDLLKEWSDSQVGPPKPSDFVLPFEKNLRGLYVDWDTILKHAGIPLERRFTPHDCRSTCVSELLASGVALTTVRDWVGHSSVIVTERYYAATRSDRRRVADERKVV